MSHITLGIFTGILLIYYVFQFCAFNGLSVCAIVCVSASIYVSCTFLWLLFLFVCLFCLFWFVLFYFVVIIIDTFLFLVKKKKEVDLCGWDLGGAGGVEL